MTLRAMHGTGTAPKPTEFRSLLVEAIGAMEAADMAVEMLARVGITESNTFDRLVELVGQALKAVSAIQEALNSEPKTIFPNLSMARAYCDNHPLTDGRAYQIHPDGLGRCTISILLAVERL